MQMNQNSQFWKLHLGRLDQDNSQIYYHSMPNRRLFIDYFVKSRERAGSELSCSTIKFIYGFNFWFKIYSLLFQK